MSKHESKLTQIDNHYFEGRFADAERMLYEIVGRSPQHWGAWHRLAAVSLELGKVEHAEKSARRAIEINPGVASLHGRLGAVLRAAGKLEEAVAAYQQSLSLNSEDAVVWYNLGNALQQMSEIDRASRSYQKAIQLQPSFVKAIHHLARLLANNDAPNAALSHYEQALKLTPGDDNIWVDKGNLFDELKQPQNAIACFNEALSVNPDSIAALSNLGNIYRSLNRYEESLNCYDRAIAQNPDHAVVLNNRGITLAKLDRFTEAEASYQEALVRNPEYANAFYNLGDLHVEQLQFDTGVEYYKKAIEANPNHPESHFHLAQQYLRCGDFEQGWPLYEWRWKTREAKGKQRQFEIPVWDGTSLAEKTILLHTEQGFGDTLQFIRYAQVLQSQQAEVIVQCPPRLSALLSRTPGVDQWLVAEEELPQCDCHAPLLSLPGLTKTTAETIPAPSPYLFADPELQAKWQKKVEEIDGFRVGIAWQGSTTNLRDQTRSIPLSCFAPLADVAGVQLLTLQKGDGTDQLEQIDFPLVDFAQQLDNGDDGFVDTAAVMLSLDLVITSDTSIAHLAGGLGVPVWVVLNEIPEWRWQMDRDDSPWYPTMRLFRQQKRRDWGGVFHQMALELQQQLG